jgi:hypothetical protein
MSRGSTSPSRAVDEAPAVATAPVVLYIAGSGRSGSTLLERVLGAIPGHVNVGELIDLPRRVAVEDEICGCGRPFSQCPFWTAVGQRAYGGWDTATLQRLHSAQHQVARQRYLPQLLLSRRSSAYAQQLENYATEYSRLVSAVAAQADAQYVVDASKWPVIAWALFRGGVDVRVVHLVRDVRGVAHSLSRDDIERPHTTSGRDVMFHNPPASGSARWLATQTEMDLAASRGVPVSRLAYTDFVRDPAAALRHALEQLDVWIPRGGLAHIDGTTVDLGPSHGLSGNPSRFRTGAMELRPDDRWRTQMRTFDRAVATTIGLPQLIRLRSAMMEEQDR